MDFFSCCCGAVGKISTDTARQRITWSFCYTAKLLGPGSAAAADCTKLLGIVVADAVAAAAAVGHGRGFL